MSSVSACCVCVHVCGMNGCSLVHLCISLCVCPCVWNEWLLPGESVYLPVCVPMCVE